VDPVEFEEVVRRRRMVRDFDDRPIARAVVERILANGQRAPSAGHSQGWAFLVLEGREQTEQFWNATFADAEARRAFSLQGLFNAPLLVVPLAHMDAYLDRYAEPDKGWADRDPGRWPVPYWYIDTGFAALLMLLTAVDAGLGALFFGLFPPHSLHATFGIPDAFVPIGALAIGHRGGGDRVRRRGRRPAEEVVHRGRW
jgi:nitroreductase